MILRIPSLDKILQKTLRSCLKGSEAGFSIGFDVWAYRKSDSLVMPSPEKIAEDLYSAREKYNSLIERMVKLKEKIQNLNSEEIRRLEEEMRLT